MVKFDELLVKFDELFACCIHHKGNNSNASQASRKGMQYQHLCLVVETNATRLQRTPPTTPSTSTIT